jgi:hypothetical protein
VGLAQHAYEKGQRVGWEEARILEIKCDSRYRKIRNDPYNMFSKFN